jgi:hypothetical protein
MIRYILALSLLCCHAQAATIPEQVARKAINGYFGELQEWQRVGYTRILDRGTTEKTAWITPYWIGEPGVDDETASGRKVELGRTAAMLEPRWGEIPYGTFVLISTAEGHILRQIWDTGSRANAGRARRRGAETWIDIYVDGPTNWNYVSKIYIVGR